jgi:hypothetical protein
MGHEKVSSHGLLREEYTYRKTGSESNKSRKPPPSGDTLRQGVPAMMPHRMVMTLQLFSDQEIWPQPRAGVDPAAKINRLSFQYGI